MKKSDLFNCKRWDSNPDLNVTKDPGYLSMLTFLSSLFSHWQVFAECLLSAGPLAQALQQGSCLPSCSWVSSPRLSLRLIFPCNVVRKQAISDVITVAGHINTRPPEE